LAGFVIINNRGGLFRRFCCSGFEDRGSALFLGNGHDGTILIPQSPTIASSDDEAITRIGDETKP
jgi:hypothetical protein